MTGQDILRSRLAERTEGFWEILATPVGHPTALQRTIAGISSNALGRGVDGPAHTPSLVELRVEALAAADQRRLRALSRTWKRPRDFGDDPMSSDVDFFGAAWRSALRFVSDEFERSEVESSLPFLADVVHVEYDPPPPVTSWDDLLSCMGQRQLTLDHLRMLDRSELTFPSLDENEIKRLMVAGGEAIPRLLCLRVLRGRTRSLEVSAQSFLITQLLDEFSEFSRHETAEWYGLVVLLECVDEFSPDTTDEIASRVASAIPIWGDPRRWAPVAYVLLRSGWTAP